MTVKNTMTQASSTDNFKCGGELIDNGVADIWKDLVSSYPIEEPVLYNVEDGSIDMYWEKRGVYCTLMKTMLQVVTRPISCPKPDEILVDDYELPTDKNEMKKVVYTHIVEALNRQKCI